MISSFRASLALLLALVTLTLAEDKKGLCDANQVPRKRLVCVYRSGTNVPISMLDPCLCNHILYDAVVVNDSYELENGNRPKSDFQSLIELKKRNPSLQTVLTVKGLDTLTYNNSANSTEYENATKIFAENVRLYLERHHLSGINLDWKYRAFNEADNVTESGQRLNILIKQLNDTLRNGSRTGASYPIIALTVTNRPHLLDSGYEFKNLSKFINFVNLPAFRFDHHPTNTVQHPSRLYGIDDIENVDSIVDLLLSEGISKEKVNVGIPTFAMTFVLRDTNMSTPGSPAGTIGNQTKPATWILSHSQWCSLRGEGNWTIERERDQTAPYAHHGLLWVGFDDETSLKLKSRYILLRNLGGVTVWSINDDDANGICGNGKFPLLKVIRDVLSGHRKVTDNTIIAAGQETAVLKVMKRSGLVKRAGESEPNDRFICSRRGYFRHPDDCSLFYRCVKLRTMRERSVVLVYNCPRGLVYDERYEICNWPSWSTPCDGSGEVFPVPKKRFVCPGVGYFQDPENCRWFYYCSFLGAGYPRAYEFRCPFALLGFDEERQACNWRWRVPGCSPMNNQYRSRQGRPQSSSAASENTPQAAPSPPVTSLGPIGPLGAIGSLLRATSSSGNPTRRPFGILGRLFPQRPTLLSLTTYDSDNRPRITYNFNHRTEEPRPAASKENITPSTGKTQTSQAEKPHSDKEEDDFSDDEVDDASETKSTPDKDVYYDEKSISNPFTTKSSYTRKPQAQNSYTRKPAAEDTSEAEYSDEQETNIPNSNKPLAQDHYTNGHGYHDQYPRVPEFKDQYSTGQEIRPDYPRYSTRPIANYGGNPVYGDIYKQPSAPAGPGLMVTVQRRPTPPITPPFYYVDSPYNTLTSRSGPRDFRIKFELLPSSQNYGPEIYNTFGRRKGHTPISQSTPSTSPSSPWIRIDFPPLQIGPSRRAFIGDTTHSLDSKISDKDNSEDLSKKSTEHKKEPIKYSRAYSMVDEKSSTPSDVDIVQRSNPSQRYIYVTPNGFTNVRPSRFYPFVEVPLSSVAPIQERNSSLHYPIGNVQNRDDSTLRILPTLKALMEMLNGHATTKPTKLSAAERRADRFGFGARIRGGARGGSRATTARPTTESNEDKDEDYDESSTFAEDTTTQISITTIPTTTTTTTRTTTTKASRTRDRSRYSDFGDFSIDPYSVEGRGYRSRGNSKRRGNRRGKSRTISTQPPTTTDTPTTTPLVTELITTTTTELLTTEPPKKRQRGRGRGSRGRGRGNARGNSKGRRRQQIEDITTTEVPTSTQPQITTTAITTTIMEATTTATHMTDYATTKNLDAAFTESLLNKTIYENATVYEYVGISNNITVSPILANETENTSSDFYPDLSNNSSAETLNDTKDESNLGSIDQNLFNSTTFAPTKMVNVTASVNNYTDSLNITHISNTTVLSDIGVSTIIPNGLITEEFGRKNGVNDNQTIINTTPAVIELENNVNITERNQTAQNETKIESEKADVDNSTNSAIVNSTKKPRRIWDEEFTTPRPEFARRTRIRTRTTRQPSRRRQQFVRERRPTVATTSTTNVQHYANTRKYIPPDITTTTTQSTTEPYNDYEDGEEDTEEEDQGVTYTAPIQPSLQGRQFRGPQSGVYTGYHPSDGYGEQHQPPSVRSRPQSYTDDDLEELSDDDYVEDDYLTDEKKSRVRATLSDASQGRLYPSSSTQDAGNQYTNIGQTQYSIPPSRTGGLQLSYGITTPRPQFSYEEILTREYSPPDPPQQFKKRIQQSTPNGPYYTVRQYQPATTSQSRSYYPSSQFNRRTDDRYIDHSRAFSRRMDDDNENQEEILSTAETPPSYGKLSQSTTQSLTLEQSSDGISRKPSEQWGKEKQRIPDSVYRRGGIAKLDSKSEPPLKVTAYPIREGEKPRSLTPPDNIPPEGHTNLPFAVSGVKKNDTNNEVIPQIACTRPGLFYHPDDCNKFYECYWDNWIKKFTLHIFECPVKLVFDDRLFGCNSIALGPCENHKNRKTVVT